MSSSHRGQLSVAVEAVTNSSHSLRFRLGLHQSLAVLCAPGPQETAQTTRLVLTSSTLRGDCPRSDEHRLHSGTIRSAHPGTRHQSHICDTSCCVSTTAAKSFNSLENLRATTPDALLTETFTPEPEAACNTCNRREVVKIWIHQLCSSLTPESRLAARYPSSPWYELCWTTDD